MKTISKLSLLAALIFTARVAAESKKDFLAELKKTADDIESLWKDNECESIVVRKKGHPLASIACRGSYDATHRRNVLDTILRHGFQVKKESYKLKPRHGMYLYKTSRGNRSAYFKLFVREAEELWPRNPVEGKVAAVYVQNVRSSSDLVRWRTLGIPLTYGLTYGRGDTSDLIAQVAAYGDEVWLAMPLDDGTVEVADGAMLHIEDALDAEKLSEYLAGIDGSQAIKGLSPLYCSHFCKNVPALRALFTALREKNEDATPILLDTSAKSDSSFHETSIIMNFRSLKAHRARNACEALSAFKNLTSANAARIFVIDAGNEEAFDCLKRDIGRAGSEASIEFVKVSEMSASNPYR